LETTHTKVNYGKPLFRPLGEKSFSRLPRHPGVFFMSTGADMVRVNIDEEFWSDARLTSLSEMTGEKLAFTRGRIIGIWHFAYKNIDPILTKQQINTQGFWDKDELSFCDALVKCGLSEKIDTGLYKIKGVDERIQYLKKYQEQGRKGGLASAKNRQANAKPTLSQCLAKAKPIEPSLLTTHYSSLNKSKDLLPKKEKKEVSPEVKQTREHSKIVYQHFHLKVLKVEPTFNATTYSQLAKLVDRLGKETPDICGYYFIHGLRKDQWVKRANFSIGILLSQAETIRTGYLQDIAQGKFEKGYFLKEAGIYEIKAANE
jgi:hypothetical protein